MASPTTCFSMPAGDRFGEMSPEAAGRTSDVASDSIRGTPPLQPTHDDELWLAGPTGARRAARVLGCGTPTCRGRDCRSEDHDTAVSRCSCGVHTPAHRPDDHPPIHPQRRTRLLEQFTQSPATARLWSGARAQEPTRCGASPRNSRRPCGPFSCSWADCRATRTRRDIQGAGPGDRTQLQAGRARLPPGNAKAQTRAGRPTGRGPAWPRWVADSRQAGNLLLLR